MPTFEEFMELVRDEYLDPNWVVGEEAAMKYFNSEEAQNYIKSAYEEAVKDFENGELNADCFRAGEVSKVAYNLYMMFE